MSEGVNGLARTITIGGALLAAATSVVACTVWISKVSGDATAALERVNATEERLQKDEALLAEMRSEIVGIDSSLTEVETQFKSADDVRNLMHANDMRWIALLWQKSFPGTTLPTDNSYYPSIANRPAVIERK